MLRRILRGSGFFHASDSNRDCFASSFRRSPSSNFRPSYRWSGVLLAGFASFLFVFLLGCGGRAELGASTSLATTQPVLNGLSCSSGSFTGAGTDTCTVTLNLPAKGNQMVTLSSNLAAVTVPASVTVADGASSASFTATVSAVSAVETATLTASSGGGTQTYAISLGAVAATVPTLTLSASTVSFGTVDVGASGTQAITLTSSGTAPLVLSAGTVTGTGFTVSGVSFPLTLNPGQTATLTVGFAPTAGGAVSGTVTLTSNSSTGATSTIALNGTGQPVLSGVNCSTGSFTGAGTDACTVTLNAAAASGGQTVTLSSSLTAVTVPASVTVAAGATTASFTATVSTVSTVETATLTASSGGVTKTFAISLGATVPTLTLSASTVSFGTVNVGASGTQAITLTSSGTAPLVVSAGTVTGTGFTVSGVSFPLTLNPGQTATLTVGFAPTTGGAASGTVTLTSNSSTGATSTIALNGTGQPVLSGVSCSTGSFTGAGTDACTVTLNAAAASGGQTVTLSSNLTAVTVPASVTVAAGATTASFTATVSAASTTETATLTASSGGVTKTFAISLGAAVPTLTLSASTVSFGTVNVGASGTQAITLTSSGTAPLVLSAGTVTGTGFTVSGVSFPLTLNPGQTATLTVGFAPTTGGAASGTVTLTSNSSTGTTTTIGLSGTGQPVLSGVNCSTGSFTGAGTDACTVTLNATAASGGQVVTLSSSLTAVTVPASVTVAAGATTASFTATVSLVSTIETATLTASSGGVTKTFAISLGAAVPTLTLQSTNIPFGNVTIGSPAYQSVTLTSSGTAPVTVSAGSASGTGYTISGVSFPATLNPGATATLEIEFDPTTAGLSDGSVTLTSNSSTGTTATISLSGTGVATAYEVDLTWDAPTSSSDPVAGYNVYRAISGSSIYQLLNASVNTSTAYNDTTVANSTSYSYYVESVDAQGNPSVPSNTFTASIP